TFQLWKFRSMRTDAEKDGAMWARAGDERVTRVGRVLRRTRIDEIPQVFNVLMGDMSFVGPRPERPVFVEQLQRAIPFYGLREAVKPGITGWAQIRYPYGASVDDARHKLEFDLYYVKNGSLFLDLGIIFHTVRHVLLGRGAR
ncbi:MAG TPA: polyisoprenyl-phosphate hexose-1-phosphate transferase ExoE, partial [Myxococcaceae bacterium]|nr:polyisoprenyl-phosphate hexose-1-phosphate transferase ExoE [Myxococcaceae bacterium]